MDAGTVSYAGPQIDAPPAERRIDVDGFLMPAVVDRHVHIRLADPGAVLLGGVTVVRDLAWPADEIFGLADASELPHDELSRLIRTLEEEMHEAAADLRFEYAARLRDEIHDLKRELKEVR